MHGEGIFKALIHFFLPYSAFMSHHPYTALIVLGWSWHNKNPRINELNYWLPN